MRQERLSVVRGQSVRAVALMAIAGGSLLIASTTWGLTVANFGDNGAPGQLRSLMNSAVSGDVIFIPPGPAIVLTGASGDDANASGDLDILKNLTIIGAGPDVTIIDGGLIDRVFEVKGVASNVTIAGLTIQNGRAPSGSGGGGISKAFGTLTLVNVIIRDNKADVGGGIATNDPLHLANVDIIGNEATLFQGGGIAHSNGELILTDVTLDNNKALMFVGGGLAASTATSTLTNVTISNNQASGGGGIRNAGGTVNMVFMGEMTLVNVTVSGNIAAQRGGGLLNDGTGIADLTNVTFSGNSAASGGAIARNGDSPVFLKNTIVANSPVGGNCEFPVATNGNNLEDADTCGLSAGMNDEFGVLANLGPLADNGGPTLTHALLVGSVAVNGGDNAACPPADQRGIPRPQQFTCDIGAYEQLPLLEVVPPAGVEAPVLAPMALLGTAIVLLLSGTMLTRRRRWRSEPAQRARQAG